MPLDSSPHFIETRRGRTERKRKQSQPTNKQSKQGSSGSGGGSRGISTMDSNSKPSEKQPGKPSEPSPGPSGPTTTSQTPTPTTTTVSSFPRLPASTAGGTHPRGGVAIGVPAHHPPRSHSPFSSFGPSMPPSSSQHQFLSPLHRAPPDSSSPSSSSTPQVRSTSGIQNIGMFSSLNAGQLRPTGPTSQPQRPPTSQPQRPGQAPIRSTPPTSSNSPFNQQQRMPTQGMSRPPSSMAASPGGAQPPSSLVQQMQMHGHSSMPPPSASPFRPPQQRPPQNLQQTRPMYRGPMQHVQQTPQTSPAPPQPTSPFLQQASRVPAGGGSGGGDMIPPGGEMALTNLDAPNPGDKIITKKTIQDLFSQIDPSEKLEADVEDALVEIAEDFVESLTTFACSLAKHRKSTTLETKDILLHAERNWNIQLPGFSGDDIKLYRKQNVTDIHRERLQLIKKSMGDHRSHASKAAAPALTSPAPQQHRP